MSATERQSARTSEVRAPLDGRAIRADFPILNQPVAPGGKPLAFLDSAASSQKPAAVIEVVDDFYRRTNANIHRGVYQLSEMATSRYEEARHMVAAFINASSARECIFVRNTTEGINLVAQAWGRRNLRVGDLVLLSIMEHHSNLVPWHLLAEEKGIRLEYIPLTDDLRLDMDAYRDLLRREPKLVAVSHVSNSVGTINDIKAIAKMAHDAGALIVVDGAQSVPHMPVDVQDLAIDFLAFSGHKMLAPLGSGVFYGKRAILEAMPPFMGGGSMIRKVTLEGSTYADIPARFEPGTPAVADAVGLGAAVEYLNELGMEQVRIHERELLEYMIERLSEVPELTMFGPTDLDQRNGVVSFTLGDIHPHDVAAILDGENVAVRAGHHCCQPLLHHLGVGATTRASLYVYNTTEDIDQLVAALHKANKVFAIA
jgi:cysteine desulfurase / selenocysteine lyase